MELQEKHVAGYRKLWNGFDADKRQSMLPDADVGFSRQDWWLPPSGTIQKVVQAETVVQKKDSSSPAEKPTLLQKAVTFAKAATKHIAAGMPQSPPEVIEARVAICQGCEKFQNNHCSVCGCACNSSTFMNKLAWAGESCPHPDGPKWGPHEANPI